MSNRPVDSICQLACALLRTVHPSCYISCTGIILFEPLEGGINPNYYTPPGERPASDARQRPARVAFSQASGLAGSDRRGGAACPVAPLGTGSIVAVAANNSGSVVRPLGSCRPQAWGCWWVAWAACLAGPGRGCPRVTRQNCRCLRHLHRHWRAQARSNRPDGHQSMNATVMGGREERT